MGDDVVQQANGDRNVQIANISESTVSVVYGGRTRKLPLERVILTADHRTSAALMVNARFGVVPFVGRDELRRSLRVWAQDDGAFSVRILAGRGGSGKTKLAVEACTELASAGWVTGLLRGEPRPDAAALEELAAVPAPKLVAVDYAETRVDDVAALLATLEDAASDDHPARVLLLVRGNRRPNTLDSASARESLSHHSTRLAATLSGAIVDALDDAPLADDTAAALFEVAYRAFADRLDRPLSSPPPRLPNIAEPTPLLVSLAAYVIAVGHNQPATIESLFDAVVRHEERYWAARATAMNVAVPPDRATRVVALATMVGASDSGEATRLLRYLPEFADSSNERRADIAGWAASLYPGPLYWNPLEPDLVGEHLVAATIGTEQDMLETLIRDGDDRARRRMLVVLGRTIANHERVATVAASWLGAAAESDDASTLFLVADAMNDIDPPRHLVARLLAAADRAGVLWGEWLAQEIAMHPTIDSDLRFEAVERLLPGSVNGHPWRTKDWTPPGDDHLRGREAWPDDTIGAPLLALIDDDPEWAAHRLASWLGDRSPLETSDNTSRRHIALALLATNPALAEHVHAELAANDPEALSDIARYTGQVEPAAALDVAGRWAASGDDARRRAALAAVYGSTMAVPGPGENDQLAVLATLIDADWAGRSEAQRLTSNISPSADLSDTVFRHVATGEWPPYDAERYLATHPADAVAAIAHGWKAWPSLAMQTLGRFFPTDELLEQRILDLVRVVEESGDHSSTGLFAETALRAGNDDSIPPAHGRLALAREYLLRGPSAARHAVLHATGYLPKTAVYENFHRELAGELTTSTDHLDVRASILRFSLREDGEWPTVEFVRAFVDGLDDVTTNDIFRRVVGKLGINIRDAMPRFLTIVDALGFEPHPPLAGFLRDVRFGNDAFEAMLALRRSELDADP